jgi:hypothetical protein
MASFVCGLHTDEQLQDYILKGHKLTSEASSKYLGVELHSDMSWRNHIDKTVKKANNGIFVRSNIPVENAIIRKEWYA